MPKKLKSDCFALVNLNKQAVLFRTQDPSINKFTFSIINKTGADLWLAGATDGTLSSFSFNFEMMLTAEVVAGMQITLPPNWDKLFLPDVLPPSWTIFPTQDMVIQQEEAVVFEMTNIICTDTAPGNFLVNYSNIPDHGSSEFPATKHLDVINLPDPAKKTLPLQGAYSEVVHPVQGQLLTDINTKPGVIEDGEAIPIYITYDEKALIENGFTYLLMNTSEDPLVTQTAAQDPPELYISFLFGEEDHDITTQGLADSMISVDIVADLPWITTAHPQGSAYWKFLPDSQQIMYGHETVRFPVHKIVTAPNVPAQKTSVMYIQLNNIPGYNDAAYTILMNKLKATATIERLSANETSIFIGQNVLISWVSSLAKRVTMEYYLKDNQRIFLDSERGEIKLSAQNYPLPVLPTAEDTVITVSAYDDNSHDSRPLHIKVSYDWPQAEILSFTGGAMMTGARAGSVQPQKVSILLAWDTRYADKTVIYQTWGSPIEVPLTQRWCVVWIDASKHSWVDFTLYAYSKGTKYPEPTKRTIQIRNLQ